MMRNNDGRNRSPLPSGRKARGLPRRSEAKAGEGDVNLEGVPRLPLSTFLGVVLIFLIPMLASARDFMSQQEALVSAFGKDAKVERKNVFLTADQVTSAEKACRCEIDSELVPRYVASR